ncbi:MAG: dipeptidase PepV [Firmicutes bacterium]|nr:dipeptidase PepV [Bacillota bacterium]
MSEYMKKIEEIIEKNFDDEVAFLQELVRCNSEEKESFTAPSGEVYPFGEGVQQALECMLKNADESGFETRNVDNYGAHIDWGKGDRTLGIIGHLDVVPAGSGWSFEPYSGAVDGGYIYGRGTTDDKGPVVAAYYAMKALREAGYEPDAVVRLIIGLDEETNWAGMEHYLEKVGPADYGFSPDAEFPAVNGEKGITTFDLIKKVSDRKMTGLELRGLSGGAASNMVPEKARALVRADSEKAYDKIKKTVDEYRAQHPSINGIEPKIACRNSGKSLEIAVEGKSAHGAHPDSGLNAISILMDILGRLNFANEDVNDFVAFYNDHLGFDTRGQRFGCEMSDEPSGDLTLNVGVLSFDKKAITLTINIRFPVTKTEDDVFSGITAITDRYDFGIVRGSGEAPIYFSADSPMVRALMDAYRNYTGDTESEPMVIGGGTYARSMPNCVAFGALFPGDPDLMHQRDERLELSKLMLTTKIYAQTIYLLTQPDFKLKEQ